MKRALGWVAGLGLVAAATLASKTASYSYGRPDERGISRDPRLLLPSFAGRLELLFRRLRARRDPVTGQFFDPVLHEGFRTFERAKMLSEKPGSPGIPNSLHCYGAAADIISARDKWNNPRFFAALGEEAKRLRLTWGGDWADRDYPHVQAVPVPAQDGLRRLADAKARDSYARRHLA